jgi:hypothetical protein
LEDERSLCTVTLETDPVEFDTLSLRQAARFFGVDPATVHRHKDSIPHMRRGGRVLIPRSFAKRLRREIDHNGAETLAEAVRVLTE